MSPLKQVKKASNLWCGINGLCSFNRMDELPMIEDAISLLQKHRGNRDLELLKAIHVSICCTGLDTQKDVGNRVVPLLLEGSGLEDVAQQAFHRMAHHSIHSWNSLISAFAKRGQLEHACEIYQRMQKGNTHASSHTFVALLQSCAATGTPHVGEMIYSAAIQDGFESDVFVGSSLVDMYFKGGFVLDARAVFDRLPVRDVVTWNALMAAQAEQGSAFDALHSFERMRIEGVPADPVSYLCILKACGCSGAIQMGHIIHLELKERAVEDSFVNNTLVDMYTKCGCLAEARRVFDYLPVRDVVTWNALIAGYAEHGPTQEALSCFKQMQLEDVAPDVVSSVCVVKACSISGEIGLGQTIHSEVTSKGIEGDNDIGNWLAHMYANAGLLSEAQVVFDKLSSPSALTWNALIDRFEEKRLGQGLMSLYICMQVKGALSNPLLYACGFKLYASVGAKEDGHQLFKEVLQKGLESDVSVGRNLISMYASFGLLPEAQAILETVSVGGFLVAWNALLAAYAEHGLCQDALCCFEHMQSKGVYPDAATFVHILQVCAFASMICKGQNIHTEVVKLGLRNNTLIGNALVSMYAKRCLFVDAHSIFNNLQDRDTVTWNTLISGYADKGDGQGALEVYKQMQMEGVVQDCITLVSGLKACGNARALESGQELHSKVLKWGLEGDIIVSNVVISMYFKCSLCSDARAVFDLLPDKDIVTWNTMIEGYTDCKLEREALDCFDRMQLGMVSPSHVTFACVLKAYVVSRALGKGQHLHAEIVLRGLEGDLMIGNLLVNMYAKLGCLAMAQLVFQMLPLPNVVSWTALIAGYAEYGPASKALRCFKQMQLNRVHPDAAVFASVLKACGCVEDVEKVHIVHNEVALKGYEEDLAIGSTLVNVYARRALVADAHQVFDKLEVKNAVSWMGLVLGYAENGSFEETLHYLEKMQSEGVVPDAPLYACVLAACSSTGAIEKGLALHQEIVEKGYETDLFVTSSLIHMYATCGFLVEANDIFDTLEVKNGVSWSAMIKGLGMNCEGALALRCFKDMQTTGLAPNEVTLTNLLSAVGRSSSVPKGENCISVMGEHSCTVPTLNHLTSTTSLLSRSGHLDAAKTFLMTTPRTPSHDTWITLLTSCKLYLEADLGLSCFEELVHRQPKNDQLQTKIITTENIISSQQKCP